MYDAAPPWVLAYQAKSAPPIRFTRRVRARMLRALALNVQHKHMTFVSSLTVINRSRIYVQSESANQLEAMSMKEPAPESKLPFGTYYWDSALIRSRDWLRQRQAEIMDRDPYMSKLAVQVCKYCVGRGWPHSIVTPVYHPRSNLTTYTDLRLCC